MPTGRNRGSQGSHPAVGTTAGPGQGMALASARFLRDGSAARWRLWSRTFGLISTFAKWTIRVYAWP